MWKKILLKAAIRLILDFVYSRIAQEKDDQLYRNLYFNLNKLIERI